ncbi:hypothetical protein [Acuticoccus sp.]|uniref:hypothetical protein n=1 Tax=Acuticoccus sp. TaxID=1904378 RepID=UPI003B51E3AC
MATEPHDLILDHLRALRAGQDRIEERLGKLEVRGRALEQRVDALTTLLRGFAQTDDRHEARLASLEKRLEFVEARLRDH